MLVCAGANVNAPDVYNYTPLHTAAACGYEQLCSLLIIYGADVFSATSDGDMPIDVAKDEAISTWLSHVMIERVHQERLVPAWLKYQTHRLWDYILIWMALIWGRTKVVVSEYYNEHYGAQAAITGRERGFNSHAAVDGMGNTVVAHSQNIHITVANTNAAETDNNSQEHPDRIKGHIKIE